MIECVLKEYKTIYDKFYKIGSLYECKGIIKEDKNNEFDRNLWSYLGKNGLLGLNVDKKYNGSNFSALKTCVAYEALAASCLNNGVLFSAVAHLIASIGPLASYGSDKQKAQYLEKMTTGTWIGANAITEQNSGSDVFKMECTAEKVKNNYIINGTKKYITNSPITDVIVLFAMTDKSKGYFGGVSCFVFRSNLKGIKISKPKEKMGLRTAQMGEVIFNNLILDPDSLIGKEGAGGQIFNSSMLYERVVVSACLTGQLDRILFNSINYFKSKVVGEKKLIQLQYIQHIIADVKTVLHASKNMVYDAALAIDNKDKSAFTKVSMAKLFVSENVVRSIKQLQEIHGAYGYLTENGLEREYRDASAALIYSGTSAIQRNIIVSGV